MSIDRLRYFAMVVETKNLRKAAELSGITPASMSKAMGVLELELGHQLIHPEGRGIGITPKGLEIYRRSLVLLEEYRRFHSDLQENQLQTTKWKFATFEVFSSYFMASFLEQEPDLEVMLLEMTPGKIEQSIIAGVVDLGITYLPSPDPSLEYREIGSFEMGVFGQKKWNELPFSEWPFAVPITELKVYSAEIDSLDMWPKSAPKRKLKYLFELLETALLSSRSGLSVIHCPDFIIKLQNLQVKSSLQLSRLNFPEGYRGSKPIKVYMISRKGVFPDLLERKLAKFMRSLKVK